ncbi:MAG: hypothetical protein J2P24_01590 [Streptosporangiales bacterium]|nr:hypothetical protein [Streptosporangiales bacterium]MBO0890313.1 hypothetical protein [Acidothermales bacterium]
MAAMSRTRLGRILDELGVSAELDEKDEITDAVVLLKVRTSTGDVAVVIEQSPETNWFDQRALVRSAAEIVDGNGLRRR